MQPWQKETGSATTNCECNSQEQIVIKAWTWVIAAIEHEGTDQNEERAAGLPHEELPIACVPDSSAPCPCAGASWPACANCGAGRVQVDSGYIMSDSSLPYSWCVQLALLDAGVLGSER